MNAFGEVAAVGAAVADTVAPGDKHLLPLLPPDGGAH